MKNKQVNKTVINGIYLYILQFFNTIIPLVTLPYITRVLGKSQYGAFNKILNYIVYLQAIVEYGFTLSGSRKISLASSDEERCRIRSSIIYSRVLLSVICMLICFGLSFTLNGYEQRLCLAIMFSIVVSEIFVQTWFFQGIQSMKHITYISIIARTISTGLIFAFVRDSNDLLLYCLLYSVSYIIISFLGMIIVKNKLGYKMAVVSKGEITRELKDAFHLFITSFSSKIFSGIAITILGIFYADSIVGGFSAIQKIPMVVIMMYTPLSQVIFPYICKKYTEDLNSGISFIKKYLGIIFSLVIIGTIIMFIIRYFLIDLLYGEEYIDYTDLLFPLGIWMCFSIINNILGIQILVARGYNKEYSICFLVSNILLIGMSFGLGYGWGALGVSMATMSSEILLSILCLFFIMKNKLLCKEPTINKSRDFQ